MHLDNFEGPFDLLLGLITKHKLDVTEIALAKVTDDFVALDPRARATDWDLDETSEFLVVAATLLDLKAARLLPPAEVEDDEDLALLEARDLLFARLLQYRAFKDVAATFAARIGRGGPARARAPCPLEARFAQLLPELVLGARARAARDARGAGDAARSRRRRSGWTTCTRRAVSVREQAALIVDRLRRTRSDELPRAHRRRRHDGRRRRALPRPARAVPRGRRRVRPGRRRSASCTIRWTGADDGEVEVEDEFDERPMPPATPAELATGRGRRTQ